MTNPHDRRYTREHEWALREGSTVLVGITHYAQDQLGDVVFLNLPSVGDHVEQSRKLGEIESVKSVADLFSPVTGRVTAVNSEVQQHPELVNKEPYGQGWLVRLSPEVPGELDRLLSAQEYEAFLSTQKG